MKAGRSAMELARSWFTAPQPVLPAEVRELLDSHPDTRDAEFVKGWPELVTKLPVPGEGAITRLGCGWDRRPVLTVACR